MKSLLKLLPFFTFIILVCPVFAQDNVQLVTQEDWDKIIPFLSQEKWEDSEKIALGYLRRFKGEDLMSDEAGIVRYMYLKSVAGLVGDKVIDKEAGLKKLKGFEGKNIVTPTIMFKSDGMFNYFTLSEEGDTWYKCSSNNEATTIHMFEVFQMSDHTTITNSKAYEGKKLRVTALIKSITAGGFATPRFDVVFQGTEVWDMD